MATYIGLTNRIIGDLPRSETSITDIVQTHLQAAIRYYEAQRFYFNEGRVSLTISTSAAYYNIPADFLKPDFISVVVNGTRYEIEPKTFQEIEYMDLGTETADPPAFYCVYGQQFRFYPKPQADRVAEVFYQKKLSTLSSTADSNAWTTDAEDLLYARTLKTLSSVRYRDADAAGAAAGMEQESLDRLIDKTEGMSGGGSLRADYL